MSYLSSFVYSTKIIGITISGVMTGYSIAFASNVMPGLLKAGLPAEKLAITWNELFQPAITMARPAVIITSFSFGFAAYMTYKSPFASRLNVITRYTGVSKATQLGLAAIFTAAVIPYTLYYLGGINKRLQEEASVAKAGTSSLDAKAIRDYVETWNYRHAFRTGLYASSFLLGLLTL